MALLLATAAPAIQSEVVDLAPRSGAKVAAIKWQDEQGRARTLDEFSGYPLVLLPIYTRCPGPCLRNVDRLKEALANSSGDPRQFRVLLFSFDPGETPAALAKYRERENIPLGWSIGTGSRENIERLLDSLGVQVGNAGTEFTHPNVLFFLDPRLRIAKWIYGTDYRDGDIDHALQIASGGSDWMGEHAQQIYALLLLAASILCVALVYYLFSLVPKAAQRSTVNPS
jgi:protein SCO1